MKRSHCHSVDLVKGVTPTHLILHPLTWWACSCFAFTGDCAPPPAQHFKGAVRQEQSAQRRPLHRLAWGQCLGGRDVSRLTPMLHSSHQRKQHTHTHTLSHEDCIVGKQLVPHLKLWLFGGFYVFINSSALINFLIWSRPFWVSPGQLHSQRIPCLALPKAM